MIVTDYGRGVLFDHIHKKTNLPYSDDLRLIGWQRRDLSIAGVVAYNTWLEDSVFMHVVFDGHAITPEMLSEAFRYPFVVNKKARVYGVTPITSDRAFRFSQRLGFRLLHETPDFKLSVMTREECRWINDSTSPNRKSARISGGNVPYVHGSTDTTVH